MTKKPVPFRVSLEGFYTMRVIRPDGSCRHESTFSNLILTQGLNRLGTGGFGGYVQVGSGSTAPLVTDTGMQSFVASTTSGILSEGGVQAAAPYYGWARRTYRFAEGVAAGNLSEVGIGWALGSNLFSRALIKDSFGDPTTITVLSDEILDVTYEIRLYAPTTDVTFDVDITGSGTHNCVLRSAAVTSGGWACDNLFGVGAAYAFYCDPYNGSIGTITQNPSGSGTTGPSATFEPYSNNSLKRVMSFVWDLGTANLAGGYKSLSFNSRGYSTLGQYQIELTPNIMKDETKRLTLNFEISWARHTI